MRKWMISVSTVLLAVQIWTFLPGHRVGWPSVPFLHRRAAGAQPVVAPIMKVNRQEDSPPQGCYAHYRAVYATCARGDRACHLRAADMWDRCEATGIWAD